MPANWSFGIGCESSGVCVAGKPTDNKAGNAKCKLFTENQEAEAFAGQKDCSSNFYPNFGRHQLPFMQNNVGGKGLGNKHLEKKRKKQENNGRIIRAKVHSME